MMMKKKMKKKKKKKKEDEEDEMEEERRGKMIKKLQKRSKHTDLIIDLNFVTLFYICVY